MLTRYANRTSPGLPLPGLPPAPTDEPTTAAPDATTLPDATTDEPAPAPADDLRGVELLEDLLGDPAATRTTSRARPARTDHRDLAVLALWTTTALTVGTFILLGLWYAFHPWFHAVRWPWLWTAYAAVP
ncbi:MAG: hypothetical protein QG608_1876, partial [Actinomycetota bacterium]|nr:hypothetical protein [Actinomycetota bacterium]